MDKKKYMKPEMQAVKVRPMQIICGSGNLIKSMNSNLTDPEDQIIPGGEAPENFFGR